MDIGQVLFCVFIVCTKTKSINTQKRTSFFSLRVQAKASNVQMEVMGWLSCISCQRTLFLFFYNIIYKNIDAEIVKNNLRMNLVCDYSRLWTSLYAFRT